MKKLLSIILSAAMLLSGAVMTAGAAEIGTESYAPMAPAITETAEIMPIDENQIDAQGIYYTLDSETMTAIVGKNTYADSASAAADLKTDSIVIPMAVKLGEDLYTVVAVGRNAFDGTDVREVVVAGVDTIIGEFAFAGCTELEYVYTAATEIKGFAFWGCTALTEAVVFMTQSIGGGAFWNCSNLRNVTLTASVIMEKAFEGCDNIEYFVFGGEAPEVAAGALGTTAKAYIPNLGGYEDFPLTTEVRTAPIIDVEDVYAKAGETVQVSVVAPVSAYPGDIEITVNAAEGLAVTGILSGVENVCIMDNAAYDAGKITGIVARDLPMALAILEVKVADNAAAGKYEISVAIDDYITYAGSVTICDHADTKTVTTKSASCEEAGSADTVCTACGEIVSTAEVAAKDHDYKTFVIEATCTEDGYSRHICQNCSHSYSDAVVEAKGHVWNEGEIKVQASTSKAGLILYTCTECGTTMEVTVPKIVYGDANTDGKVNMSDASMILQAVAMWEMPENYNAVNADANADSKVNLNDVSLLLKYIAQWDVVLGPQEK